MAAVGMHFYMLSGKGSAAVSTCLSIYDPRTKQWSSGPECPAIHHHAASAAAFDRKLYVAGNFGTCNSQCLGQSNGSSAVSMFDPETREWQQVASLTMARGAAGMAAFQGMLWIVGGQNEHRLSSVEAYDPLEGHWKQMAPLHVARCGAAVAVFADKLWAIGGENARETTLHSVEVYDPVLGEWRRGEPLKSPREGAAVAVVGNSMYITGGKQRLQDFPGVLRRRYDKLIDIERLSLPDGGDPHSVEKLGWEKVDCKMLPNMSMSLTSRRDYHALAAL
eukprot:3891441-Prymnesium_polylepis.1